MGGKNCRKMRRFIKLKKVYVNTWVKENWVDTLLNKRSDGSYPKCGRSGGEKRKNYPIHIAMGGESKSDVVKRKQAKAKAVMNDRRKVTKVF